MLTAQVQKLMELRVSKGWSKSDLAKEAKVNHSMVVRVEQGRGTSPRTAKNIADALGVNIFDVFAFDFQKGA